MWSSQDTQPLPRPSKALLTCSLRFPGRSLAYSGQSSLCRLNQFPEAHGLSQLPLMQPLPEAFPGQIRHWPGPQGRTAAPFPPALTRPQPDHAFRGQGPAVRGRSRGRGSGTGERARARAHSPRATGGGRGGAGAGAAGGSESAAAEAQAAAAAESAGGERGPRLLAELGLRQPRRGLRYRRDHRNGPGRAGQGMNGLRGAPGLVLPPRRHLGLCRGRQR